MGVVVLEVSGRQPKSCSPGGKSHTENEPLSSATSANVLPHLPLPARKMDYLAHLVGVLLNHLFVPACRVSQQYDKDHMVLW